MASPAIGVAGAGAHTALSMTAPGAVVGTPYYMSPEQVRGEPVDARADIWAFGCVLYETLTGRRPFRGASVPDTLAAILDGEPDWTCLPAATPPHVRALLRRCLARDLRRRVKHMSAVRLLLEEDAALSSHPEHEPVRARRSRAWIAAAIAVVAAGAGFAAASWLDRAPAPPVMRTAILAEASLGGTDPSFAFLPDGRLAYISRDARQILVRPMDSLDAVAILSTVSYLRGVFPSPDGLWVASSRTRSR